MSSEEMKNTNNSMDQSQDSIESNNQQQITIEQQQAINHQQHQIDGVSFSLSTLQALMPGSATGMLSIPNIQQAIFF
jgi:hypothetical protein